MTGELADLQDIKMQISPWGKMQRSLSLCRVSDSGLKHREEMNTLHIQKMNTLQSVRMDFKGKGKEIGREGLFNQNTLYNVPCV